TGAATTAGTYSGANVKTVTDEATGAVHIQLADNPEFTTVKTGNSTLSTTGLAVTGAGGATTTVAAGNISVGNGANIVVINGTAGTVNGLTNTTFDADYIITP